MVESKVKELTDHLVRDAEERRGSQTSRAPGTIPPAGASTPSSSHSASAPAGSPAGRPERPTAAGPSPSDPANVSSLH